MRGSRQELEVEYEVAACMAGRDGIVGFEIQYDDGGNYEHAYVNSKAYVQDGKRTLLTFRFRRVKGSRHVHAVSP